MERKYSINIGESQKKCLSNNIIYDALTTTQHPRYTRPVITKLFLIASLNRSGNSIHWKYNNYLIWQILNDIHTCSTPGYLSAAASTAIEHEISAEPPPYTIELLRIRFLATHKAS